MLVYNTCTHDARVLKEAATLRDAGHEVTVIAVLDRTTVAREQRDGITILRIDRRPVHYRLLWAIRRNRARARRLAARVRRLWRRTVGRAWRIGARLSRRASERLFRRSPYPPEPPGAAGAGVLRRSRMILLPLLPIAVGVKGGQASYRAASRVAYRSLMRLHKPLMYLDWYGRAYRAVLREGADVVHAHDLNTLPVGVAVRLRRRVPCIYDAHELYPDVTSLSSVERRTWRVLERPLTRRATTVITVCEPIAEEIARRCAVPVPLVVMNCPDQIPPAAVDRALLLDKIGMPESREPIVIYQGGFSPNRGLPSLVRAAALLERGIVVLMGWGRLERELATLVRELRLEHRVKITGPVPRERLLSYSAAADIGVIPYEPIGLNHLYSTPNKLFEYIAAGVPVVASDLPEMARVVRGGDLGLTFAPVAPEPLAEALGQLLFDDELRARMRSNALSARSQYTWERQGALLLDRYRRLSAAPPS